MFILRVMLLLVAFRGTHAQPVTTAVSAKGRYVVDGRERWRYPGQRATSAPWSRTDGEVARLDSTQRGTRVEALFGSRRIADGVVHTVVWRAPNGGLDSVTVTIDSSNALARSRMGIVTDATSKDDMQFSASNVFIGLLPMHFGGPTTSARPTRISLSVRSPLNAVTVVGTVVSRVVGDSLVDGQMLQIIVDSGRVELTTRSTRRIRTLFGEEQRDQRLRGMLRVRRVYDARLGMTVRASDTLSVSGTETRREPSGREYSTAVSFERQRTIALLDSAAAREASEARLRRYGVGVGMLWRPPVGAPSTPDLRSTRVVDSLLQAHALANAQHTRDSIERRELLHVAGVQERLARVYAAEGDTARALALLELGIESQITAWVYHLVRPALADPRVALKWGLETNKLFEAFEYAFSNYPLVLARDARSSWCSPEACDLIAAEWPRAREPRLRLIGLMARFSRDPMLWGDTVDRLAATGVRQLSAMSARGRGVLFVRPDESPLEMPSASADWRVWMVWLRGGTDSTLARRDAIERASGRGASGYTYRPTLGIRDIEGDQTTVKFAARRHGVSYIEALQTQFAAASSDTARYVLGSVLAALGAPARSPAALLSALTSRSVLDRTLASREVQRLPFERADSTTAQTIEATLFGYLLDGQDFWGPVENPVARTASGLPRFRAADSVHVVADSLTPASIARLKLAGIAVHPTGWDLQPASSGRVVRIGPVHQAGEFVQLTISNTSLVRLPDGRGGGNASGTTLLLVRIEGVWKLLDTPWYVT